MLVDVVYPFLTDCTIICGEYMSKRVRLERNLSCTLALEPAIDQAGVNVLGNRIPKKKEITGRRIEPFFNHCGAMRTLYLLLLAIRN